MQTSASARRERALIRASHLVVCVVLIWGVAAALAQSPESKKDAKNAAPVQAKTPVKPEEKVIRDGAQAFADAFNRGDAKAIAALCVPDCTMIDESGEVIKGREAIQKTYETVFKERTGRQMEVEVTSVQFPTESVAIEDGVSKVTSKRGGPPAETRYTAIDVLKDGKWQLASVRELPGESNRAEAMQDIAWLAGTWEGKIGKIIARSKCHWIVNDQFIQRDHYAIQDGVTTAGGIQIIGWDPQLQQVHSWSFDQSGGFGEGLWTATPEGWRIQSNGVLPDGAASSSVEYLTHVPGDDNVVSWRSTERVAGGDSLPDTPEVVVDRVKEKK